MRSLRERSVRRERALVDELLRRAAVVLGGERDHERFEALEAHRKVGVRGDAVAECPATVAHHQLGRAGQLLMLLEVTRLGVEAVRLGSPALEERGRKPRARAASRQEQTSSSGPDRQP